MCVCIIYYGMGMDRPCIVWYLVVHTTSSAYLISRPGHIKALVHVMVCTPACVLPACIQSSHHACILEYCCQLLKTNQGKHTTAGSNCARVCVCESDCAPLDNKTICVLWSVYILLLI